MRGLMYKDLILNKTGFIVNYLSIIFCSILLFAPQIGESTDDEGLGLTAAFSLLTETFYFACAFFINGAFETNIFKADESKKWAYFVTSTPMRAEYQVQAKYWLTAVMSTVCLALCSFMDALNCLINKASASLSLLIMTLFYIQIIIRAFEMPFLIRFGTNMGSYYKLSGFLLLLFIALIYGLFGDLSHFGSIDDFYDWLIALFTGKSRGFMIFSAALPYFAAVSYYLSYKISCGLYMKGAEKFEK